MTGLVKVSRCRPLKRGASCVALPHKAIHTRGPEPAGIRLAQGWASSATGQNLCAEVLVNFVQQNTGEGLSGPNCVFTPQAWRGSSLAIWKRSSAVHLRAAVQSASYCAWIVPSAHHLSGLLNLDSRPLSGNSVRRAGSNSPPRSGPQPELRRGPAPDSVHSFFGRFERFSPGGGGTRKVHFSGWVGIFATWRWS